MVNLAFPQKLIHFQIESFLIFGRNLLTPKARKAVIAHIKFANLMAKIDKD